MRAGVLKLLLAAVIASPTAPSMAGKFGPAALVEQAREQADSILHFIVRGKPSGLEAARAKMEEAPDAASDELPFVDGILLSLKAADALLLAEREDVEQVYYVHKEIAPLYARTIKALAYSWQNAPTPGVINMSFGPEARYMPIPRDVDDPMNLATRKAAERGFVIVMAIGNYYNPDSPNPGVVNPWCQPDWVICAGAVDAGATTLFEQSARGSTNDRSTWPTVVAFGIGVLSTWPSHVQKSAAQQAEDEASAEWRSLPDDLRMQYAVMSGTSQAAAQVSRAAAQLVFFLRQALLGMKKVGGGEIIFSLDVPRERVNAIAMLGPRLIGDVARPSGSTARINYRVAEPWRLVKQILMDTAQTMRGYGGESTGAGFVSPAFIDAQFGHFGIGEPRVMPLKIF